MPPARRIVGPPSSVWALACMGLAMLAGCEFNIPSPTYIAAPTLIAVTTEVVELGPLNPDRVGVPFDAKIAEAMPGDRYALEAVVIDADGERLLGSDISSIWFQCGVFECSVVGPNAKPSMLPRCDELDPLTLDDLCRMTDGDHRAEFLVPELGPQMVDERIANYYGIVGWDGRTAEDCLALLEARESSLTGCAFVQRPIKIGPSWWLLAYADSIGLSTQIPLPQIPAPVYLQAANRVPSPSFEVYIDGELAGTYPETSSFKARLGSELRLDSSYDELEQLTQTYFAASYDADSDSYWFRPVSEIVIELGYSTRSLHALGDDTYARPRNWTFDAYADPGPAQLFVTYYDDRYGEGYARLDFEVGP